jgi:hypothetical protein
MEAVALDETEKENLRNLLFDVQRSIRYHDRRVAHFDWLHKVTSITTIFVSGVVLLDLIDSNKEPEPVSVKVFAAVAAVFGIFDLVYGFSHRANQHRDFKRRFCALERDVTFAKSAETVVAGQLKRMEIDAEEPPIFRALDAMCYNETLIARDWSPGLPMPSLIKVPLYQRWTARWVRWEDASYSMTAATLTEPSGSAK